MADLRIEQVFAWEALDSRGSPTVACLVRLAGGSEGVASVPSGASVGTHEALERRDGGERYGGRGVLDAVASVNGEIAYALAGLDAGDQELIDEALKALDESAGFYRLGANAVLAASVACALASAGARRVPLWHALNGGASPLLPMPMVNMISGGAHAGGLIDIQDVLVIPIGANSFAEAIEWATAIRRGTAAELRSRGHATALVADEGGLAAPLRSNREALDVIVAGIERAGLDPGSQIGLAVDVAASELFAGEAYHLPSEGRTVDALSLVDELRDWAETYPLLSLEDPLAQDDDPGWQALTQALGFRVQIVGDDRFVTSPDRLLAGIHAGIANAVLVKPNQVGTLSDARRVVELAHGSSYATVVSARSGETEDAWLADLAVGWSTGQIKVGSTMRSERTAKWNRLLRIEAQEPTSRLARWPALKPA
jgi:enolase